MGLRVFGVWVKVQAVGRCGLVQGIESIVMVSWFVVWGCGGFWFGFFVLSFNPGIVGLHGTAFIFTGSAVFVESGGASSSICWVVVVNVAVR